MLKSYAARGLGKSGHRKALDFLHVLKMNPPKAIYSGDIRISVDNGIKENQIIQEEGIKQYFEKMRAKREKLIHSEGNSEKGEPVP